MSKNIDISHLADTIADELKKYSDDVSEKLNKEYDVISKKALDEIVENSPHRPDGTYKKGWKRTKVVEGGLTNYIIYNKTRYFLIHLLEYGHAKRSGGMVPGKPHVMPAAEKAKRELLERTEEILKGGG